VVAFGPVAIASTPVLDRLRIELHLPTAPAGNATVHLLSSYVNYFQRRPFWCWAAVAKSVARFYRPSRDLTQCQIAGLTLGRGGCCSAGPGQNACDVQTSLVTALKAVGHFAGDGPPDVELVCRHIDEGRPVGIFIEWTPRSGHFAAIYGYSRSSSGVELVVADPKYGARPVLVSELLRGRYRGSGRWTRLYRTKE
jgi:hypothetical protein